MKRKDIRFSEKDIPLREDVRILGAMVGELIQEQGGDRLFEAVESARRIAIQRREGEPDSTQKLTRLVTPPTSNEAEELIRAFSTWFQVVNTAENVHRIRRRRELPQRHHRGAAQRTRGCRRDAGARAAQHR